MIAKYLTVYAASILFWFPPSALSQPANLDALQGLGKVEYHRIEDSPLEQTYHIYVALPAEYDTSRRLPVVYLLDGGITFPMLTAYSNYLHLGKEIPQLLMVGISYGTNDWNNGNQRSRDFTVKAAERSHWGGAPNFLAFLQDSLFPLIENRYPADPKRRIIFGQSLGGQFVLYAAQAAPGAFWGHIASNPALHRNLDYFLKTRPQSTSGDDPPRLFVASGSEDRRFRGQALQWMTFWNSQTPLPWALQFVTLEGHSHFSGVPVAFREGLRWIFEPPGADR